ncbi:MAG: hypothetical protein ACQCN4_03430 [Candidatus Bathyarchaeia archaeon]
MQSSIKHQSDFSFFGYGGDVLLWLLINFEFIGFKIRVQLGCLLLLAQSASWQQSVAFLKSAGIKVHR